MKKTICYILTMTVLLLPCSAIAKQNRWQQVLDNDYFSIKNVDSQGLQELLEERGYSVESFDNETLIFDDSGNLIKVVRSLDDRGCFWLFTICMFISWPVCLLWIYECL